MKFRDYYRARLQEAENPLQQAHQANQQANQLKSQQLGLRYGGVAKQIPTAQPPATASAVGEKIKIKDCRIVKDQTGDRFVVYTQNKTIPAKNMSFRNPGVGKYAVTVIDDNDNRYEDTVANVQGVVAWRNLWMKFKNFPTQPDIQ